MSGRRRAPLFSQNFDTNLAAIRLFLGPAGTSAFQAMLDRLFVDIVPMLCRYPRSGRDFMKHPVRSSEAAILSRRVKASLKNGDDLREFVVDDYIVLYLVRPADVVFLSIKHHRQLSFDLRLFWTA